MNPSAVVLLVEDRTDDVLLILRAFERAGISNPLQVVKSGEEALQYLQGSLRFADRSRYPLPQLILLDLKLTGMDGFEVLNWIRQESDIRSVPVLVLTSSDRIQDVNRAYNLGANSFLVKPLEFENYAALGKLLRTYWLQTAKTRRRGHRLAMWQRQLIGSEAKSTTSS
jgi:CheY-like chemotaxis protein